MTDLDNIRISDINLNDPTPELSEYIKRNQNLITYYASGFLTDDLSADPYYTQLSAIDQHLILAFAFASIDINTYEVLNRPQK
jgi:hypothetical protein